MRKRYLAMLMAVLMCLGLFATGAMAADEAGQTPVETTAPAAESAAPSETPVETAQPGETYTADVPQPVALEGEEGNKLTQEGEVTEGTGGEVIYKINDSSETSPPTDFAWTEGSDPNDDCEAGSQNVTHKLEYIREESSNGACYGKITLDVSENCPSGEYSFTVKHGATTYTGTLTVKEAPSPNPTYEYKGFTVNAWTLNAATLDENTQKVTHTAEDVENLKDVVFDLCCGEEVIASFTTDENGNATITPGALSDEQIESLVAMLKKPEGERDGIYLKESYAPNHETYGERPLPNVKWEINVHQEQSDDGKTITFILDMPEADEYGIGRSNGEGVFEVYNDRYVFTQLDVEKTVKVKHEGVDPGSNTFDFLLVLYGETGAENAKVTFTPEGGKAVEIEPTQVMDGYFGYYNFSMQVSGAGTARGTVTIGGWEGMYNLYVHLYETTKEAENWEQESPAHLFQLPVDDEGYGLLYDNVKLMAWAIQALDTAPEGGEGYMPGYGPGNALHGYDEKWYSLRDEDELQDIASFVSVYTAAPTAPTAPAATAAPTATPAATPATSGKQSPKTGDEANAALWLALAAVSAMGIAMVMGKKKVQ